MSFTQFTSLPPELQSLIWENCIEGPSMHIFDVCFPSWRKTDRTAKAFKDTEDQSWIEKYSNTAFLDPVDTSDDEMNRVTRIGRYPFDPSMYRATNSLLSTSRVASGTARFLKFREDTNTVYLPARKQKVTVSNSDVLMLRFRDAGAAIQCAAHILFSAEATSTSNVLKSEWSTEMAETVRNAKKIALDVSESWMSWIYSNAGMQETAYFASTMQRGLEVLYLVDQCAGRCEGCGRAGLKAENLQRRDECWKRLNSGEDGKVSETAESREGDVIHGVSKRYVEVFDLKGLGWEVTHPSLFFAMRMQSVIRNQQRGSEDEGKFQGIRVLMVEDESIEGLDTELRVNCRMKGVVDNPMDKLSPENMAAFSQFLEADSVGANHTEGRIFRMALGWDGVVSSDCTDTTV